MSHDNLHQAIREWTAVHPKDSLNYWSIINAIATFREILGDEWLDRTIGLERTQPFQPRGDHFLPRRMIVVHPLSQVILVATARCFDRTKHLSRFAEAIRVFREDPVTAMVQLRLAMMALDAGAEVELEPPTDDGRFADLAVVAGGDRAIVEVWSAEDDEFDSQAEAMLLLQAPGPLFFTDDTPSTALRPSIHTTVHVELRQRLTAASRKQIVHALRQSIRKSTTGTDVVEGEVWRLTVEHGPVLHRTGPMLDYGKELAQTRKYTYINAMQVAREKADAFKNPEHDTAYWVLATILLTLPPGDDAITTHDQFAAKLQKKIKRKLSQTRSGDDLRVLVMRLPKLNVLQGSQGAEMLQRVAYKTASEHRRLLALGFVDAIWAGTDGGEYSGMFAVEPTQSPPLEQVFKHISTTQPF